MAWAETGARSIAYEVRRANRGLEVVAAAGWRAAGTAALTVTSV